MTQVLADFSRISCLCNEAELSYNVAEKSFGKTGTPTEAAMKVIFFLGIYILLKVLAEKLGVPDADLCQQIFSKFVFSSAMPFPVQPKSSVSS